MTAPVLPPPLHDGDRLSRDEFMRRWEAMPHLNYAELINGVVYMASRVSNTHGSFQSLVNAWPSFYAMKTPGCDVRLNATWLMAEDGVPQPDSDLRILPQHGGQSRDEGDYPAGAPELVVEVSHTTTARDAGIKKRLYERNGVREYLIARTDKQTATWFRLVEGQFKEIQPETDGWFRSPVFPGLWLDVVALWRRDLVGLSKAVEQGVSTPEHAEFVSRLAR